MYRMTVDLPYIGQSTALGDSGETPVKLCPPSRERICLLKTKGKIKTFPPYTI